MAKGMYIGVDNKARKVKQMYVGVHNSEKVTLPNGYTQVKYIESTGTQHIDTGYAWQSENVSVEIGFELVEAKGGVALFGSEVDYAPLGISAYMVSATSLRVFANAATTFISTTVEPNTHYDMVCTTNNGTMTKVINGTTSSKSYNGSLLSCESMIIFATNDSKSDGVKYCSKIKLKYFRMKDNGVYVRNYVPCVTSSGVAGLYELVNSEFYPNDGTGTFVLGSTMAESVARRVKKGYIGIGGVARPFWGDKKLEYYGTISPLSVKRMNLEYAGANVGNYALIAGGYSSSASADVDCYNESLTKVSAPSLSVGIRKIHGATVGDNAIFAGGQVQGNGVNKTANTYTSSLTRSTCTAPKAFGTEMATVTIGGYALFTGGYNSGYNSVVSAYNSELTMTNPTSLSTARRAHEAVAVGDFALIAGGQTSSGSSNTVETYNKSLTKGTTANMSFNASWFASASVGNYAILAGGYHANASTNPINTANAYDASLTRTVISSLSARRRNHNATSVGDYAIFAGGNTNQNTQFDPSKVVDVYDKNLVKHSVTQLNEARIFPCAISVGDYALFAGGYYSYGQIDDTYDTVEAYKLV